MFPLSLVIPVADEPRNETLPLALESIARHVPWVSPFLIGGWSVDEYGVEYLPFLQQRPGQPMANTTRMLGLALDSDAVTDPFIWSNDDIYFRGYVSFDDLLEAGATARGKLNEAPKTGTYGRLAHRTANALRNRQPHRPFWDYERHVPLVVNKAEMRRALDLEPDGFPRSLYQNLALDEPALVAADVKVMKGMPVPGPEAGPIFSTGNGYSVEAIRSALRSE